MTIISKFPGTCKTCGGRFAKGNQIEWSRAGGARHLTQAKCEAVQQAKAITHVLDATQDTPLGEVARLIYNSPCSESNMALYLEGTLDWVDDWAGIEETLNEELDLIYEGELEANQGRDEDQRIGYSDRHGN